MISQPDNTEQPAPDPSRQEMAKAYTRARRRYGMGDLALGCAMLLVLLFGGFSARLAGLANMPPVAGATLYFVALVLVYTVLTSPLSYYGGFVLNHRYGISKQAFSGWLADQAKGRLLSLVFGAGIVALIYWFLASFPEIWWLLSWAALLVLTLLITVIAPVIIVPLFFKMKPLADADLKARLEQLARRAKANVRGIYVIGFGAKMTAANAALMGMGKTRRIVLSDTLLNAYSQTEIEVIMAHELGHHAHRDILRLFTFQGAWLIIIFDVVSLVFDFGVNALGFSDIADVAAFPLLLLISGVLSLASAPVINSFTRYVESAADEYALRLTDNPSAFISAMTRLTDQNLSVAKPARWEEVLLYDHPSYRQRIAHARSYVQHKRG